MSLVRSAWMVLLRDISASIAIDGEDVVVAVFVLDVASGLMVNVAIGNNANGVLRDALGGALEKLSSMSDAVSIPELVLCRRELVADLRSAVRHQWTRSALPSFEIIEVSNEAEDIVDSFIGHINGRAQPNELPSTEDWHIAFAQARNYVEDAPWQRWADDVPLLLEFATNVDPEPRRYLCVVIGAGGYQMGLALYPGTSLPAATMDWLPGMASPIPPGSLMLFVDPPPEIQPEFLAKAVRYGWDENQELVPSWLSMSKDGAGDVSSEDLRCLSVAVAAVVAHDRRGPIVVGRQSATKGTVALAEGITASFTVLVGTSVFEQSSDVRSTLVATSGGPKTDGSSIAELFELFLSEQRDRLVERTWQNYASVIELFSHSLNSYGPNSLDQEDYNRWQERYEFDPDAFIHLFGAEAIIDNLGEFLSYFMAYKVAASPTMVRSASTVTKRLVKWLLARGEITRSRAAVALDVASEAAEGPVEVEW